MAAMQSHGFDVLTFFTAVLVLQLVLSLRPRKVLLLCAGHFFYACWDWRFLRLVWATTATAYLYGRQIHQSKTEHAHTVLTHLNVVLPVGVSAHWTGGLCLDPLP